MFSFSAFIGAAICLLPAQVQAPKKPAVAENYFPMKLGDTWTYEVVAPGRDSGEVQTFFQEATVSKITQEKEGYYAVLEYRDYTATETRDTVKVARVEKYYIMPSGVLRIAGGENASEKLVPPLPLIRYPLTPEKAWGWKGKIIEKNGAGKAESAMSVTGPEEVETPAGKFIALQVHCEQVLYGELNGKPKRAVLPVDYWFAPNVGLVQRKVILPQTTVSIRLKSYKLAP